MARRVTPAQFEGLLRKHAFLREQVTMARMNERSVRARARAVGFWMVRGTATSKPRPDKLTHRSGRGGRSVKVVPAKRRGEKFVWGLTSGGPGAPHMRIHEFGGKTRAHVIRAHGGGRMLRWKSPSGGYMFSREVHHPGSVIPARPVVTPALQEQVKGLAADLRSSYRAVHREVFG